MSAFEECMTKLDKIEAQLREIEIARMNDEALVWRWMFGLPAATFFACLLVMTA